MRDDDRHILYMTIYHIGDKLFLSYYPNTQCFDGMVVIYKYLTIKNIKNNPHEQNLTIHL
jgi:hypothetical protein